MGKIPQSAFTGRWALSDAVLPLSEVHRARSKRTGGMVALKKIIMHNEKDGVSPLSQLFPTRIDLTLLSSP